MCPSKIGLFLIAEASRVGRVWVRKVWPPGQSLFLLLLLFELVAELFNQLEELFRITFLGSSGSQLTPAREWGKR